MSRRTRDPPLRRRDLLAAGGTALAGVASSLAGCSALPPLGERVQYGRVDAPEPAAPTYREWLPAPSALPDDASSTLRDGYGLTTSTPSKLRESVLGARPTLPGAFLTGTLDYFGVGIENYDFVLYTGDVAVLEGDVDLDVVAAALDGTGYERADSVAGYDLFTRSDAARAVGVRDGRVLFSRGSSPTADVRTVEETRRGEYPRYHERNSEFETLSSAVGARPWTSFSLKAPTAREDGDPIGVGDSLDYDEDSVYSYHVLLYPDDVDVTERRIKQRLSEWGRALASRSVEIEIDGQLAIVEMQMTHERYEQDVDASRDPVPQITWGAEFDLRTDRVTFRHEAGDPVETDRLEVLWDGVDQSPFADPPERVEPGDSLTISRDGRSSRGGVFLSYRSADEKLLTPLLNFGLS